MRFLPKILARLFPPVPLPEAPPDSRPAKHLPLDERIAALTARIGDRMIAAEAGTVAAHRDRVAVLLHDFAARFEEHHGH